MKRKIVIGVAALAVAAFAGGAFAATQQSKLNPRQAFISDVAKRLHVTPQELRSAVRGAFLDQLNAAVAAGRLTRAQATAIRAQALLGPIPLGALMAGPAPAFGRPLRLFLAPRLLPRFLAPVTLTAKQRAAIIASRKALLDRLVAHKLITKTQEQRMLALIWARSKRLGAVPLGMPILPWLGLRYHGHFTPPLVP